MEESVTVNRTYKDRLFKIIFEDKKELLNLYNALTGKDYQNPDELEINTLEDVIYIHLKNDVSFILDERQNLFEQQSTFNPNQPLRGFFYFADLYKTKYLSKKIYSSKLLKIPTPQYIVFYNGTKEMPDKTELRLSDSFQQPTVSPDVEVIAHMFNINYGHNMELLNKCRKLKEYALFIDMVRYYLKQVDQYTKEQAIEKAIDTCIEQEILTDILVKERLRIMASILSEFDEIGYKEMIREEAYEDGFEAGHADGLDQGIKQGITQGIQQGLEQGIQKGIQKGMQKGMQQGIQQGKEQGIQQLMLLISEMNKNGEQDRISELSNISFCKEMLAKYNL